MNTYILRDTNIQFTAAGPAETAGVSQIFIFPSSLAIGRGVQSFGVFGPHWKKKSCLGTHIKYIVTRNHNRTS